MPTTSDILHWRLPTLADPADAPDQLQKLAADAEVSVSGTDIQTYVPSWSANGDIQPVNPAVKQGRFRLNRGWCTVSIYMEFSAATGGGSGDLYFTLPVTAPSSPNYQYLSATIWIPSLVRYFEGPAQIDRNSNLVWPIFSVSDTASGGTRWRCTDGTHMPGTSVPIVSAGYNIQNGGLIAVRGTFLAAES